MCRSRGVAAVCERHLDVPAELAQAVAAAESIKEAVSFAVNTKSPGVKGLQNTIASTSGGLDALLSLASRGYPVAYEALQILCYRNAVNCQSLVDRD